MPVAPVLILLAALAAALPGVPARAQAPAPPLPSVPPLSPPPLPPPLPAWPAQAPLRVLQTPDWSDYRVYPAAARAAGAEGLVAAQVLIGRDGVPKDCRITISSGSVALDDGTCVLLRTMRFGPTLGADAQPIETSFAPRIRWLLQDPRPFASSLVEAEYRRADDGRISCVVRTASGAYAALWQALACGLLEDHGRIPADAGPDARRRLVAVRLVAGNDSTLRDLPWPQARMIAQEQISFGVNGDGDAIGCKYLLREGMGQTRSMNNLSVCGQLLPRLWLDKAAKGKTGVIETRIYTLPDQV